MSIDALSWAFNLELPNSGAKLTLLALANYANEDNEAYPSQKAISKKTCLCERAIRTHLVTLEELGLITRKGRKRANGSFTSDLFQIHIGSQPASGKICQRQNLPAEKSANNQRQNFPNPAADSAYPDPSLNTTVTKSNHSSSPDKSGGVEADTELQAVCKTTWESYKVSYFSRYGIYPLRNASANAAIKSFCKKIPCNEAPHVAAFYVSHNSRFYVEKTHPPSLLNKDAEGLRTQWATGRTSTSEKFDPIAYVNRNRPNGGSHHEIVIEHEKRN